MIFVSTFPFDIISTPHQKPGEFRENFVLTYEFGNIVIF